MTHLSNTSIAETLKILTTGVIYFLSAKAVAPLSLVESSSVFAIWPPTGIALAALLLFEYRIWPGIFIGAMALNMTLTPIGPSLQIAVTNTLGPLVGFWYLRRFAGENIFHTARAMAHFFLAIIMASLITASGGAFALWLHGLVAADVVSHVLRKWFLGDLIGFLLIAPIVESIRTEPASIRRLLSLEGALMLATLGLTGLVLFGPFPLFDLIEYPVVYFFLPPLIWGTLRFGSTVAVTLLLFVAIASIYGTIAGYGPFLRENPNNSLLLLQSLNGMLAVTILLMAAVFRERGLAQNELRAHKEHLEELVSQRTSELEAANKQLTKLDHLKTMFIASMSHELRTPLNAIIGFTGVLLGEKTGALRTKQKEYLQRISTAGKHLLHLVIEVIDISKLEAGRIDTCPEHFSLEPLLAEAATSIEERAAEKGILLEIDLERPMELFADREKLLQCLKNYLSNALKYSEKGTISLKTADEGTHVSIAVTDMGIGIDKGACTTVFEAFERLDSHLKVKAGGAGLGLYLTKKIVEDVLGGTVFLCSEKGVGSTFGLRIPKEAERSGTSQATF